MEQNLNEDFRIEQRIHENISGVFSLTPLQEGMLFHKLLDSESNNYFEQNTVCFQGKFNIRAAIQAMNLVTYRHDALRANFVYENVNEPRQVIFKCRNPEVQIFNISKELDKMQAYRRICDEDKKRGFDLSKDPLIRTSWIKYDKDEVWLILSFHHIIMDGWCLSIIMGDFMKYFQALDRGKTLSELEREIETERDVCTSYADYLCYIEEQDKEIALQYWEKLLSDCENISDISPLMPVLGDNSSSSNECFMKFTSEENKKIIQFCRSCGITINTLIEAAIGILIQKLNRVNTVTYGKIVSGRDVNLKDISEIVGLFINCIPIKVQTLENQTVTQLVQSLLKQATESKKYEHCSLADIQSRTSLGQNLIKVILAFENYYVHENTASEDSELEIKVISMPEKLNYDISFLAYIGENVASLKANFDTSKFSFSEVTRLLCMLHELVNDMVNHPDKKVSDLDTVTEEEKTLILKKFNSTEVKYPREKTVIELFEEQVEKNPEKIAVVFENQSLTYAELNAKANQLAYKLRDLGVKPDDFVAIFAERNINTIIGVCGILKSGAAYVPLDSSYPESRIKMILKDCQPKAILVDKFDINVDVPVIKLSDVEISKYSEDNPSKVNIYNNLAYCIYTSGTTGIPKGVLVQHNNIVKLVINCDYTDLNENTVILQTGQLAFDASTFEIWGALLNGGQIHLINKELLLNADEFKRYIIEHKINTLFITTALFNQYMNYDVHIFDSLSHLMFGGEKTAEVYVKKLLDNNKGLDFRNVYGPTETTTFATHYVINEKREKTPIGKPISNTNVYILNKNTLCGIGVPGELCISGAGVARGYLNQPELTAEKFVDNPFGKGKMYRSGDLARWLPDGNIEFLGRIDEQVKIRGFRIELGEIESKIRDIESVKECAVIARTDKNGDKAIYAYYTGDKEIDISEIRNSLSQSLP
ncbi:MAG: amino acid adenylation domain-containing protein, partial [Acutalibacteraceae bacterium]|nr:amino acid adenylation domain-containing protein [Acutalibacteraceae bacterium]